MTEGEQAGLDVYVIKDEPAGLDDKPHSEVDAQTKAKDESQAPGRDWQRD